MTTPNGQLGRLASEFRSALEARLSGDPAGEYRLPSKDEVTKFCRLYLEALFPLYYQPEHHWSPHASHFLEALELQLAEQFVCAIRFDSHCRGSETPGNLPHAAE